MLEFQDEQNRMHLYKLSSIQFGERYTQKVGIPFHTKVVCVHFTAENAARVKCGLNIDLYFGVVASWEIEKKWPLKSKGNICVERWWTFSNPQTNSNAIVSITKYS